MNLTYILPRVARHFLPEKVTRMLLLRGVIIRPGLETRAPQEAAERYRRDLNKHGIDISGKHILILGYGGRFALACHLLKMGATHITLCEYAVQPDEKFNADLLPEFEKYLAHSLGKTKPRDEWITLLQGDIRELATDPILQKADIICSSSVFEHLSDPTGILDALLLLISETGVHLHYIDLRDHFFKFPFEMLTFTEKVWKNWLNPTSHLNRWRLPAFQSLFAERFGQVELDVLERDLSAWQTVSERVLPEHKSGDPQVDAVTQIKIFAGQKL